MTDLIEYVDEQIVDLVYRHQDSVLKGCFRDELILWDLAELWYWYDMEGLIKEINETE